MLTTIVSTDGLAEHLEDSTWVIVDCRYDLKNKEWGAAEYEKAHIPGAVFVDLLRDLSGPITPDTGRHPLPEPAQFRAAISRLGIDAGKQVVVYDAVAGAFAARLWWMLRNYGHPAVAVLDGGLQKWQREGRPMRSGAESREPTRFEGEPRPEEAVDAAEVERIRLDPSHRLIDARNAVRFRGEQEPLDTTAGHIPGAVNRFHEQNLSPDGTFLSPEELRANFEALLGDAPAEQAVVYCGSGVTSCHHLVAMEHAGLTGARLYPGSWSEWIRDEARPQAKGEVGGEK